MESKDVMHCSLGHNWVGELKLASRVQSSVRISDCIYYLKRYEAGAYKQTLFHRQISKR